MIQAKEGMPVTTTTVFTRPVSPNEHLYLANAKPFSHMLIHLVVEGLGIIDRDQLARALADASHFVPGCRLRLAGRRWIADAAAPRVIERTIASDVTTELNGLLQNAPMFDAKTGYTCDVLLLRDHLRTYVVFRVLHAVMDGKGMMIWAEAVFQALRGGAIVDAASPMIESTWLASQQAPTVKPPVRGPAYAGPRLDNTASAASRFQLASCALKTSHPATLAKLCTGVQSVLMKKTGDLGRVMVPVDIRPNLPPEHQRSTANLTLPLFLSLEDGADWQAYAGTLLSELYDGNHLVYREAYRLHSLLPSFLLSWSMKKLWQRQVQLGKYLCSTVISHLGRVDLKDFSTDAFQATLVMATPSVAAMAPFTLAVTENVVSDEEIHTTICIATSTSLFPQPTALLQELIEKSGFTTTPSVALPPLPPKVSFDDDVIGLHQLFEREARKTPQAPCLVFNGVTLDYDTANKRANQIAHYLLSRGIQRGDFVGAGLLRSHDLVIAWMAIMKAGGAYVPMDPETPQDRLEHFVNDSQAQWVLTTTAHQHLFANAGNRILLDRLDAALAAQPTNNPDLPITGDDVAYLLYTSGSTGLPKGAVNTHAGIVNTFAYLQQRCGVTAQDVSLFRTPIGFDGTILEIITPLQVGASIVIVPPAKHSDARFVLDLIREQNVSFFSTVPSILEHVLDEIDGAPPPSLTKFMLGGEAFTNALYERILHHVPHANIMNVYGPAESSNQALNFSSDDGPHSCNSVPIGKPLANMQAWLVDHRLNPVPPDSIGELIIAGIGVGKGYWRQPELTATRFFPHPCAPQSGLRAYRTGDLCRLLPDGNFQYVGRNDQQVKIRGARIELGEIEHILKDLNWIRQAAVIVRKSHGQDVLVAFLSVTHDCTPAQKQSLRAVLDEKLPPYMVPSIFQYLDELPLNANEKIDRKALKNFSFDDTAAVDFAWSDDDRRMAKLWQSVLGIAVAPESNFFMLGGDSVLALKLMRQIEAEFGLAIEPQLLFEHGNFAAFTQAAIANVEVAA
jgi:amino acid adenylation domain-containing protein